MTTPSYVPSAEDVRYEVPGRQLGWRVNQLQQQGYPYQVQPAGGGVYIVIVQQPPAVDPFAYQAPSQQHKSPRLSSLPLNIQVAAIVVVVALFGYLAYAFMGGAAILPQSAPAETRTLWATLIDGIGIVLAIGIFALAAWMLRALAPMVKTLLRRGK